MVTINIYTAGGTQQAGSGNAVQGSAAPTPEMTLDSSGGVSLQHQTSAAPQPSEQMDMPSSANADSAPSPQMDPASEASGQSMDLPSPSGNMEASVQSSAEVPMPTLQPREKASDNGGDTPQPDAGNKEKNNVSSGGESPSPASQPPADEAGSAKSKKR